MRLAILLGVVGLALCGRATGVERTAEVLSDIAITKTAEFSTANAPEAAPSERSKPNIVLLLADDLGYGDLTCYNSQGVVSTPDTDRLAREGMRFTDSHSASAVCSPTRYGLLTGRYCWRTSLKYHVLRPWDPPLIEVGRLTLPGMLKQVGYHTACIGKWHLGWNWTQRDGHWDFTQAIGHGPTHQGFDFFFGVDAPNYPPFCFIEGDRTVGLPTSTSTKEPKLSGWRFDDILPTLSDKAVECIQKCTASKQPFFLYFPLTSPHFPIVPSKEYLGKSGINPLADFMLETDAVVGRVLDELDRQSIAEKTLVFYAADNGAGTWRNGIEELMQRGHHPSGPFRQYKGSIYEGGHRVPLIVRWPGRVPANSTSQQLVCLNDLMATCADIVGATLPPDAAEDSVSFLPALTGRKDRVQRESIVHHSNAGQFAIRQGKWKLILPDAPPGLPASLKPETNVEELYDLESDPSETINLRDQQPHIAERLSQLLQQCRTTGRSVATAR